MSLSYNERQKLANFSVAFWDNYDNYRYLCTQIDCTIFIQDIYFSKNKTT